jgi:hypothetical protein
LNVVCVSALLWLGCHFISSLASRKINPRFRTHKFK